MPHSAISSTVWPSTPVSPTTKDLVARFFHLVDQQDDNVGPLLAEEIFTPDARFVSANSAFEGKEEIAKSRASAWNVVTFRKHTVDKVYAGSPDGADLVLTGTLESRTKGSGSATIVTEFAGRAEDQALPGVDWAVLCSESIMMDA